MSCYCNHWSVKVTVMYLNTFQCICPKVWTGTNNAIRQLDTEELLLNLLNGHGGECSHI